jgi:hypothetical protein
MFAPPPEEGPGPSVSHRTSLNSLKTCTQADDDVNTNGHCMMEAYDLALFTKEVCSLKLN